MQKKPVSSAATPGWVVFCAAVDNYGDIGVCWRLARQLTHEYGITVQLWVDDWAALARFLAEPSLGSKDSHAEQGVQLLHWRSPWRPSEETVASITASAVIIEAFACALPDSLVAAMANSPTPPLWLNLEYLSAEDWVRDCHGLPSPQSIPIAGGGTVTLHKYFFFPGFVEGTGGLLREADLLARHASLQSALPLTRRAYLAPYALPAALLDDERCLVLSLFCYEGLPLRSLLAALSEADESSLCLVPEGRSLASVKAYFELDESPVPGAVLRRGALTLVVLPFSSQDGYDRLLSLCDFNFVRGEDSFVRAQFAARPMLWHLYPQEADAHLPKMEAFLTLYSEQSEAEAALHGLWRGWNQGEDCRDLWHHLRPLLPALQRQARNWQQKLAQRPDLAANLLQFYRERCE
jgi:uncharacterized repeat protein (TIGR03837 family)